MARCNKYHLPFIRRPNKRREKKSFVKSQFSFILALALGVVLAVGGSVWATSVGTDVTVSGKIEVQSSAATSTFSTGGINVGSGQFIVQASSGNVGISSTTPAQLFSVGGSAFIGASSGGGTLGGFGIGKATTTAGAFENIGPVLFGDVAADVVNFNAANLNFNNAGTSTIPISATAWGIATSTGGAGSGSAFVRFNTTNTRVGIATSTPGNTFSVTGDIHASGGLGIGAGTTTPGSVEISGRTIIRNIVSISRASASSTLRLETSGTNARACIEFKDENGTFRLIATSAAPALFQTGTCD